jgi:hypothetical protein
MKKNVFLIQQREGKCWFIHHRLRIPDIATWDQSQHDEPRNKAAGRKARGWVSFQILTSEAEQRSCEDLQGIYYGRVAGRGHLRSALPVMTVLVALSFIFLALLSYK